jgi:hypothetical protein
MPGKEGVEGEAVKTLDSGWGALPVCTPANFFLSSEVVMMIYKGEVVSIPGMRIKRI